MPIALGAERSIIIVVLYALDNVQSGRRQKHFMVRGDIFSIDKLYRERIDFAVLLGNIEPSVGTKLQRCRIVQNRTAAHDTAEVAYLLEINAHEYMSL